MKHFQYKTIEKMPKGKWIKKFDTTEIDTILNRLGKEGWELVAVLDKKVGYGHTHSFFYTFKKEI